MTKKKETQSEAQTETQGTEIAKTFQTEAETLLQNLREVEIQDTDDLQTADEMLSSTSQRLKDLEEHRKRLTRPLDEAKKGIMELFKRPEQALEQVKTLLKNKMLRYHEAQEKIRQEEARKAAEEARKAQEAAIQAALDSGVGEEEIQELEAVPIVPIAPKQAAVGALTNATVTKRWTFIIEDASLIPREFLLVDEKKISKIVQAMKADTKIPGVRVYTETDIRAGRAS